MPPTAATTSSSPPKAATPNRRPGCYNLQAKPEVEVQIGRDREAAVAKVVEPSDPDYDRLWKIVNENNGDRYTAYQEKTDRPIPVVVLTPAPTTGREQQ